ncbi:MAG: hypothetical protein CBC83_08095 [Flavobacteriales bacterium TMED123]|nr:MAG: hypothetical protein CBC83_08095 [Flavobacteriales bacterium TMED123]|tara:strand:+ start:67 stop:270 length:204 start_codon:yes stop_codon:yes gene_type:complete
MSGANLDGYNYAWKKSTLKSDLEKKVRQRIKENIRVDTLEEGMIQLVAVLALMNQTMDQIEEKENAN